MPQQINKKILLYLFLFIILGTFNNKKINKFDFPEIDSIQIDGLETDNGNFLKKIESLNLGNIFFLKNILLTELFDSNNIIEEYKIFKKYPSSLEVKVIETKFHSVNKFYCIARYSVNCNITLWVCHFKSITSLNKSIS